MEVYEILTNQSITIQKIIENIPNTQSEYSSRGWLIKRNDDSLCAILNINSLNYDGPSKTDTIEKFIDYGNGTPLLKAIVNAFDVLLLNSEDKKRIEELAYSIAIERTKNFSL